MSPKADALLARLEAGGVDNWEWYYESVNPPNEKSYFDLCKFITEEVNNE